MPYVYRTQVSIALDTLLARDKVVMTPWFVDSVNGNADAIRDGLYDAFMGSGGAWFTALAEVTVKVYAWTAVGADVGAPISQKTWNAGIAPVSSLPREVALCLSFYATANVKRQRGRLYLPLGASSYSTAGIRPTGAMQTKALTVGTKLGAIGPASVQWAVHSEVDGQTRPVTTAWCDDEWDTQRRRGMRPTNRSTVSITA